MRAPLGAFASIGNHDAETDPKLVGAALRRAGVQVLADRAVRVGPIALIGMDSAHLDARQFLPVVESAQNLGGVPVLDGCSAFLECRSFATYPGGDHAVFLGEVENFERTPRKPLAFGGGRYMVAYAHESGPTTPEAGAEGLAQLKAVRMGCAALPELRDKTGLNLIASVWGNRGPTVVHWEPSTDALTESIRVGRVMSTLDSATGSVFTAFLPRAVTQAIIDEERSAALAAGLPAPKQEELDAGIDENRRRGVVIRAPIEPTEPGKPHRVTVSVPVLDHAGQPALVLSATGPIPATGCGLDAPLVNTMVTAAAALSRQLGYKPAG